MTDTRYLYRVPLASFIVLLLLGHVIYLTSFFFLGLQNIHVIIITGINKLHYYTYTGVAAQLSNIYLYISVYEPLDFIHMTSKWAKNYCVQICTQK